MLTISLDRVRELLEKAEEIELPELAVSENAVEDLDELLADDPAYGGLMEALETLAADEVYELLALGLLARSAAELDEWHAMIEQARAIPMESAVDDLARTLLLTDEIEIALERLGYLAGAEEEEPGEAEEEEGEPG